MRTACGGGGVQGVCERGMMGFLWVLRGSKWIQGLVGGFGRLIKGLRSARLDD